MDISNVQWHPMLNAFLNFLSGVCIVVGYYAIKQGKESLHRKMMGSAVLISTVFLVSYLIRVAVSSTHLFPGTGWWRILYYIVLFTHMILAALVPFLVGFSVRYALIDQREKHKKLVKWTYPIWLYVSVTGVFVYLMLYQFPLLF